MKDLPPVGELDVERGEFWIENPWKMNNRAINVSAYEPNQVFLNFGSDRFIEIGYLTTADSDGDGRGAMVADVTGDLQPDILVRQAGGGPIRIYANRFPPTSRLVVSLNGVKSNRLGIGATVIAEVGGRRLMRQMFPDTNFASSQANEVRFGLGKAEVVDRLIVQWPAGLVQEFESVPVGNHIRITEGRPDYEILFSSSQEVPRVDSGAAVVRGASP